MPYGGEAALQALIGPKSGGDLRQAQLQRPADETQCVGHPADVAHVVGEIHLRPAIAGLAGRVNNNQERAFQPTVQPSRHVGFVGEKISRDEGADFTLRLHGDFLPGAKMAAIALRRRAGR